jgi:hypothetical protein
MHNTLIHLPFPNKKALFFSLLKIKNNLLLPPKTTDVAKPDKKEFAPSSFPLTC